MHYIFVSYARDSAAESHDKFVADLRAKVAAHLKCSADEAVFDDSNIRLADSWKAKIECELATCKCFIALVSPSYIESTVCGREWAAFSGRLASPPQPLLFPIIWQQGAFPEAIARLQFADDSLGKSYAERGLRYLIELGPTNQDTNDSYERFLDALCQRLHGSIAEFGLPDAKSPLSLDDFTNPFERAPFPYWPFAALGGTVAAALLVLAIGLYTNARQAIRSKAEVAEWIATVAESEDPEFIGSPNDELLRQLSRDDTLELAGSAIPIAPGAARVLLDFALSEFGDDARVAMLEGSWQYQDRAYERARSAFSRAIELGESTGLAYASRAKCRRQLGDRVGYQEDRKVACHKGLREACDD